MNKAKETVNYNRGKSLIADIFRSLDPELIDALKKLAGIDTYKKQEENIKDESENKADWDDICDKQYKEDEKYHNDVTCQQCEACNEDYESADDMEIPDTEDVLYCDSEIVNEIPSYMSKISLNYNEDKKAVLTVLYVSNMDAFEKYSDKWMSDAFEIACSNNINNFYMYGSVIDIIKFKFYLREDYNKDCTEDRNVLLYPVWYWDPEILSFYSEVSSKGFKRQYVRMLIDNNGKDCSVIRRCAENTEDGEIVFDLISDEQRADFIKMLNNIKDKKEATNEDECEADCECEACDHDCETTCEDEDINCDTTELIEEDENPKSDKKCAAVVDGFINMDICKNCPDKNRCRPQLNDYTQNTPVSTDSFMYKSEEFVRSITNNTCSVITHSENLENKNIRNYWKGKVEKDICLDRQNCEYSVYDFLDYMLGAVKNAIECKKYYYYSDDNSTTIAFKYKNIVDAYYDIASIENDAKHKDSYILGLYSFGQAKPAPDSTVLLDCADELADFLCARLEYTHVGIISTEDDYMIICDY